MFDMFCSLIIRSWFLIFFTYYRALAISCWLPSFVRFRSRHVNVLPSIERIGSDFYIYVTCGYFTLGLTHSNSIQKNERLQTAGKKTVNWIKKKTIAIPVSEIQFSYILHQLKYRALYFSKRIVKHRKKCNGFSSFKT